ncbi:uncharacterized protein LOC131995772 [Stomoxys calcitrans]|uniref:uncharacterized protein LOC131995772 n=1 Tax=Stomoxys calcitrans TaxID=35570 RepID=UPI0027E2CAC0|nr:uncharacterized protein LOC131995772 [Stomoxys calcitrans]
MPSADPAISVGMRDIIASAVGSARIDFEIEQTEIMNRLIPTILEATRRSLSVGNSVPTSNVPKAPIVASQPGRPLLGQGQHKSLGPTQTHQPRSLPYMQAPVSSYQQAEALYLQLLPFVPSTSAVPSSSVPAPPVSETGGLSLPSVYRNSYGPDQPNYYTRLNERPQQPNTSEPPPYLPPPNLPGHSSHFGRPGGSTHTNMTAKLNLAKWGIKFDGTSKTMNVQEFIFRVGELKRDYEKLTLDWYWNEFQIQTQILNRRQQPQESFEDFYNAVIQLRNQQKQPYREAKMVEIMRGKLKTALAQMIFSVRVNDLGSFYRDVKRAESLLASHRQQYQRPNLVPQRVHELAWEEELRPEAIQVDAIQGKTNLKCWNCGVEGHSWVDCAAPKKLFCYRCGHDGVTVRNCSKCQGNRQRIPSQTGEVRSTPV